MRLIDSSAPLVTSYSVLLARCNLAAERRLQQAWVQASGTAAGTGEKKKKTKVAWKTLIPFSLPSVLFVILSSVNFHPYVCFSAMPSQLSASCLLGSLRGFFFPFFFSRPCLYFLLPLSESLQEGLRSN